MIAVEVGRGDGVAEQRVVPIADDTPRRPAIQTVLPAAIHFDETAALHFSLRVVGSSDSNVGEPVAIDVADAGDGETEVRVSNRAECAPRWVVGRTVRAAEKHQHAAALGPLLIRVPALADDEICVSIAVHIARAARATTKQKSGAVA